MDPAMQKHLDSWYVGHIMWAILNTWTWIHYLTCVPKWGAQFEQRPVKFLFDAVIRVAFHTEWLLTEVSIGLCLCWVCTP